MQRKILKIIVGFLGKKRVLGLIKYCNNILRKITLKAHSLQMNVEWEMQPVPEWFDHHLDMYYQWEKYRNPLWLERGLFNALAIKEDGNILELCCGDGFNAKYFYSIKAKSILSVDFDNNSIAHAQKYNKVENVKFHLADIRYNMPGGIFDTIIWDAAIEHFTKTEIEHIVAQIKKRLKCEGILTGYTIAQRQNAKSFVCHEYEFLSKEDLSQFLSSYFRNVKVFETIYPTRHNLYFWASDSVVPFDLKWGNLTTVKDSHLRTIIQ